MSLARGFDTILTIHWPHIRSRVDPPLYFQVELITILAHAHANMGGLGCNTRLAVNGVKLLAMDISRLEGVAPPALVAFVVRFREKQRLGAASSGLTGLSLGVRATRSASLVIFTSIDSSGWSGVPPAANPSVYHDIEVEDRGTQHSSTPMIHLHIMTHYDPASFPNLGPPHHN